MTNPQSHNDDLIPFIQSLFSESIQGRLNPLKDYSGSCRLLETLRDQIPDNSHNHD